MIDGKLYIRQKQEQGQSTKDGDEEEDKGKRQRERKREKKGQGQRAESKEERPPSCHGQSPFFLVLRCRSCVVCVCVLCCVVLCCVVLVVLFSFSMSYVLNICLSCFLLT